MILILIVLQIFSQFVILTCGVEIPFDVLECFESNECGITSIGSYNFSLNQDDRHNDFKNSDEITDDHLSTEPQSKRAGGHIFQIKNGLAYDVYFYWDVIKMGRRIMTPPSSTTSNNKYNHKPAPSMSSKKRTKEDEVYTKTLNQNKIFIPAFNSIYLDTMIEESHILRLFVKLNEFVEELSKDDKNIEKENDQNIDDKHLNVTNIQEDHPKDTVATAVTTPNHKKSSFHLSIKEGDKQKTTSDKKEKTQQRRTVFVDEESESEKDNDQYKIVKYEVIDKSVGQKEKKIASGKLSYNCDFFYKMCYFMLKYQSTETIGLASPRCQDGTYEAICKLDDKNRDSKPQSDLACINTCMTTYFSHIINDKSTKENIENDLMTLEENHLLNKNDLLHCFFFSMVERKRHLINPLKLPQQQTRISSSSVTNKKDKNIKEFNEGKSKNFNENSEEKSNFDSAPIVQTTKPFSQKDINQLINQDQNFANFLNELDTFSTTSVVCEDVNSWKTAVIVLSIILAIVLLIILSLCFISTPYWKSVIDSKKNMSPSSSSSSKDTLKPAQFLKV